MYQSPWDIDALNKGFSTGLRLQGPDCARQLNLKDFASKLHSTGGYGGYGSESLVKTGTPIEIIKIAGKWMLRFESIPSIPISWQSLCSCFCGSTSVQSWIWTCLDIFGLDIWKDLKHMENPTRKLQFGDVSPPIYLPFHGWCWGCFTPAPHHDFARRRLCERCQGTTGTTVKDGSCRKSTRICVIYIDLCWFMLIYIHIQKSRVKWIWKMINYQPWYLLSTQTFGKGEHETTNPVSHPQAAGRSRRMYKERSMTPTPWLMSERFHEDQKQQKS